MPRRTSVLAAALAASLSVSAWAQATVDVGGLKTDPGAPIEVEADSLAVNQTDGSAAFEGNVLIAQGDMRLSAAKVEVSYDKGTDGKQGKIRELHASGKVTLAAGKDAAEADDAVYTPQDNRIVLTGNVLVTQGQSVISGQKMVVDLATGTGTMEGRVRTVLQPGGN